jgi:hypothetical protein
VVVFERKWNARGRTSETKNKNRNQFTCLTGIMTGRPVKTVDDENHVNAFERKGDAGGPRLGRKGGMGGRK